MNVLYLKLTGNVCSKLQGIRNQLSETHPHSLVDFYIINYNLITTDSILQGYLFLLYYSSTLLVITENSWDEPDNCKQSKSQIVIEEIKRHIPVYHTQGQ